MELSNSSLLRTDAYINGEWVSSHNKFDVQNPATQEIIGSVPDMAGKDTITAIEGAHEAWEGWRNLLASERSNLLRKWYDLQIENQEDFARIITAENGKPLNEARGEVLYGAKFTEWYAEEAKRTYGETLPTHKGDARALVIKQPVGVVGAITPWNFPYAMITRKVAPALAAGCPVIIKPSELTPLCALALAALAEQAGIPKGVLNILTSNQAAKVGEALTQDQRVRKITFTGSTAVGKKLMAQSANQVKKVSLELGGNAAFIVFDDADIDVAVQGLVNAKYRNTGQVCVAASRIFIQDTIYDAFAEKFGAAVKEIKVGNGTQDGIQMGPLINDNAVEKVKRHVGDALDHGASLVTGGAISDAGAQFYQPTVLKNATQDMLFWHEETFGPVAPLFKFSTEEEVVSLANHTPYGLANYFYTKDIGRAWRVAEALESGIVSINEGQFSNAAAPFGGFKESGIGREGGHHGLDEFLETKYIFMGGL